MGLFGGDTSVFTATTSEATDKRTLAEQGGVAAQSVGGDLIFESASVEAIGAVSAIAQGSIDLAGIAADQIGASTAHALDIVAATRGTQPINLKQWALVILAVGGAWWLAKGKFA